MITVIAGYEPKAFYVHDGVELQLDPQDPVNGRQRVLRVLNKDGITVALFATWTSATRENDPDMGVGYHRQQAAAAAGIDYPKDTNA